MTRAELEHIIRASGDITDEYEFIIVGSQAILGPVPHPEQVFTVSMEADIYPKDAPHLSDKIDGAIGEGSQFHDTYGYYAQGVDPSTAILPGGWQSRVHKVQSEATNLRIGYCIDLIDLFLSKAAANREKDREFCMALMAYRYVRPASALALTPMMPLEQAEERALRARIRRWAKALRDLGHDIPDV